MVLREILSFSGLTRSLVGLAISILIPIMSVRLKLLLLVFRPSACFSNSSNIRYNINNATTRPCGPTKGSIEVLDKEFSNNSLSSRIFSVIAFLNQSSKISSNRSLFLSLIITGLSTVSLNFGWGPDGSSFFLASPPLVRVDHKTWRQCVTCSNLLLPLKSMYTSFPLH